MQMNKTLEDGSLQKSGSVWERGRGCTLSGLDATVENCTTLLAVMVMSALPDCMWRRCGFVPAARAGEAMIRS